MPPGLRVARVQTDAATVEEPLSSNNSSCQAAAEAPRPMATSAFGDSSSATSFCQHAKHSTYGVTVLYGIGSCFPDGAGKDEKKRNIWKRVCMPVMYCEHQQLQRGACSCLGHHFFPDLLMPLRSGTWKTEVRPSLASRSKRPHTP